MTNTDLLNQCWEACYNTGDLNKVKYCLQNGLNINARKPSGARPLDAAINVITGRLKTLSSSTDF